MTKFILVGSWEMGVEKYKQPAHPGLRNPLFVHRILQKKREGNRTNPSAPVI